MERESENNLLCSPAFFSFKGVSALLKNGVVGGGRTAPFSVFFLIFVTNKTNKRGIFLSGRSLANGQQAEKNKKRSEREGERERERENVILLLPRVRLTFGASKILSFFLVVFKSATRERGKKWGRRWQERGGKWFPPSRPFLAEMQECRFLPLFQILRFLPFHLLEVVVERLSEEALSPKITTFFTPKFFSLNRGLILKQTRSFLLQQQK